MSPCLAWNSHLPASASSRIKDVYYHAGVFEIQSLLHSFIHFSLLPSLSASLFLLPFFLSFSLFLVLETEPRQALYR